MNVIEMFAKIGSGSMDAHSELGTRDENRQKKNFGTRIQKMKTVTGINARVLVFKDAVIPFNPFTGEPDDTYNAKWPFRPILTVSQVLEGINSACASNETMKEFWQKTLGMEIPVDGVPTMEEYYAFKKAGFIKPRVMSYSTVAMNFGGIQGLPDYKAKYTVDPTELNEQGSYDLNIAPPWHRFASLFSAILKPKADAVQKKLAEQKTPKDKIKAQRSLIFQESPIGFVSPTNLIPFLFLPHNAAITIPEEKNPRELEQSMRFYTYSEKWSTPINEAMNNNLFDSEMDFFDFTLRTPSTTDRKTDGSVYTDDKPDVLYQAMSISNTDGRMSTTSGKTIIDGKEFDNNEMFEPLRKTIKSYFFYSQEQSTIDGGETFEKIMAQSNRFRPITTVLDKLAPACAEVFNASFANSPYFTEKIKDAYSDILIAMNPDNALAFADKDQEDLDKAAEEQQADIQAIIAEVSRDSVVDETVVGDVGNITDLELS